MPGSFLWPFVFYFCSSAAVYILGGSREAPSVPCPPKHRGERAGEVGMSYPPLSPIVPLLPSPLPGAVYYCERINRETLILPHVFTAYSQVIKGVG